MKVVYTDVLVIGGGLAGLRVAIGARRRGHDAIVLSRGAGEEEGRTTRASRSTGPTGGAAIYELIHPFELQISLGPAMTKTQQWARAEVPFDLMKYPGSPRNPRMDDPLLGHKFDQGVAFLRAIRGERQDYPTFRDGAAAQQVVDAVDAALQQRRWIDIPQ